MKLMLFNHFDLQKGQGHILQPNRSLNNFYVCLPHPSLGSSALFGSLKSRNYQRYFAIIVDECCDMPYRSPHLLCPASANIADSADSRRLPQRCLAQGHAPFPGQPTPND